MDEIVRGREGQSIGPPPRWFEDQSRQLILIRKVFQMTSGSSIVLLLIGANVRTYGGFPQLILAERNYKANNVSLVALIAEAKDEHSFSIG